MVLAYTILILLVWQILLLEWLRLKVNSCTISQSSDTLIEVPKQVNEQDLPPFSPRNLWQFEAVFMMEQQLDKCEDMFERKVKSSNPLFHAWKVLKSACLPTKEMALERVIQSHTPQNIQKRKAKSGRKGLQGANRFNSISDEWIEIMKETPNKKTKEATAPKLSKSVKNSLRKDKAVPTKRNQNQMLVRFRALS